MKKIISIIIPSCNRVELLTACVSKLIINLKLIDFLEYEIVIINSGKVEIDKKLPYFNSDSVKLYNFNEKLDPGISRNLGIENSKSEWVWFIDDDDEIQFDELRKVTEIIKLNKVDIIGHSFKFKYEGDNIKNELLKNILLFKERQEVFNFIFKREIIKKYKINFSKGLHEDIRYVAELLISSQSIEILGVKIYNKILRDDSITKDFNIRRIDGYLNSIMEIIKIKNYIITDFKNDILTQCLGTILYIINSANESYKKYFLQYLKIYIPGEIKSICTENFSSRSSNFKYSVSIFLNSEEIIEIIKDLDYCFNSHLSCNDLKSSIFLGPQEVIGCCKRFFFNGKMKGDIILMDNSSEINLNSILNKKKDVENLINVEKYEDCEGCPYLQRFEKNQNELVNYISLENFTFCNMRCSYCSPKYYGGKDPAYDTDSIISELLDSEHLGNDVHIVWGGGEPTLKPKFDIINKNLLQSEKVTKIRVLTNSLKFSEPLSQMTENKKIRIVTSVDAGNQEKFKQVRGKGNILDVFENLKNYNKTIHSPENITIKYILTEENYYSEELDNFINLLKEYNFEKNFIQISCNFKTDIISRDLIISIYELAGKLLTRGFEFVYLDDLIRDRLHISDHMGDELIEYLKQKNIFHKNILSHQSSQKVILWGDGFQSEWIKKYTLFGKSGNVFRIISKGEELDDISFSESKILICPSAIQSLPEIYKEIKKSNLLNKTIFGIFI